MAAPTDELHALHTFAVELAGAAMRTITASRPEPATAGTKADAADWVTPFDREVERHTRDEIARRFPSHRVVGEEYGGTDGDGFTWYVDPIDGTTNFVHGLPWSSYSLAGFDSDGVAVGVVADPARGEVFSAVRGGGAFIDGRPVGCRSAGSLAGEVLLTEWSKNRPWPGMFAVLTEVSDRFAATRIMGSCALALASVGAGRAAAALLPGRYNLWDVAAGALIAREGGALVYARDGASGGVPEDGILAATRGVAKEVWRLWRAAE
ncbi:inositol monophosphatase family protein [Micromonospora eburnea]|uniref:inositol-phosphate phosphatase n=1 Tax=Micromonospora eburnea TaxID=227316 RepID=A0A1C6UQV3_9ACTN|nr:inositol monophosphatase family protein [Micromonospora eburnea]SCL56398.1 myo-inositol-1(or 4)-monophosphatase [Micromonospora eburnea]